MLDEAHKVGRARKASRLKQLDRRMSYFVKDLRLSRVGAPAIVWGKPDGAIAIIERGDNMGCEVRDHGGPQHLLHGILYQDNGTTFHIFVDSGEVKEHLF